MEGRKIRIGNLNLNILDYDLKEKQQYWQWHKGWTKNIEEIKKHEFSENQISQINSQFEISSINIAMHKPDIYNEYHHEIEQLKDNLTIATNIAFSSFRKNKPSFISKLKIAIKELNFIKEINIFKTQTK